MSNPLPPSQLPNSLPPPQPLPPSSNSLPLSNSTLNLPTSELVNSRSGSSQNLKLENKRPKSAKEFLNNVVSTDKQSLRLAKCSDQCDRKLTIEMMVRDLRVESERKELEEEAYRAESRGLTEKAQTLRKKAHQLSDNLIIDSKTYGSTNSSTSSVPSSRTNSRANSFIH